MCISQLLIPFLVKLAYMQETVIVGGFRTPFGKLGGSLSSLAAVDFTAPLVSKLVSLYKIAPETVDEVLIGQVIQAGCGQIPSRQVLFKSGLPSTCESTTINKVCASGMKAVTIADLRIRAGYGELILAGGMECMSQAPYLVDANVARFGKRMGNAQLYDAILKDGLDCPVNCVHMGVYGAQMAKEFKISRSAQDEWALMSHQRAVAAQRSGRFAKEILPINVPKPKGESLLAEKDEGPRADTSLEALSKLKPVFDESGTVTAGNAPSVNDGAAMLLIMSLEKAWKLNLKPLAKIVCQAAVGQDPPYLATVPALSLKKALEISKLKLAQLELIEINEAFASVAIISSNMLGVSSDIVNVNGGAIALGHPIGASGARILLSLALEMQQRDCKYGAAAICSGTGQGDCVILSREGLN
jgi:acetyl-CoA C-acetyltransferase